MKTIAKQNYPGGRNAAAFTLIELLVVIGIIGVVASLIVAGIGAVTDKKGVSGTKAQLARLELALESYKSAFGSYPPDDPATAAAMPHWNSLAYELGGVRRSGANYTSESDPTHTVTPAMLSSYFNLGGLVNVQPAGTSKHKYALSLQRIGTGKTADAVFITNGVVGIPAALFLQVPAQKPDTNDLAGVPVPDIGLNVWKYRAYPAGGHNPKSYDLWAEIRQKKGTNTIGNWK
ncbi:MAG: type II secretion system protein [Limisphaerales bacterium]